MALSFLFFENLIQPFYQIFMHLSSLHIDVSYLLEYFEDHFYQRLRRYTKQRNLLYHMGAT